MDSNTTFEWLKIQESLQQLYMSSKKIIDLRVKDLGGKYDKLFSWMYEGPVNGVGTYCEPCAQDERESKSFISKYF